MINRTGVAGLFYKLLRHSLIKGLSHCLPPNLQNIITPKPLQLGICNFERVLASFMCHMSHVICHVSHVMCIFFKENF